MELRVSKVGRHGLAQGVEIPEYHLEEGVQERWANWVLGRSSMAGLE